MLSFAEDKQKHPEFRTERYWVATFVSCWLGILWAASPTLHDVAHLIDIEHDHPTGSRYSHREKSASQSFNGCLSSDNEFGSGQSHPSQDIKKALGEPSAPIQDEQKQNEENAPVINLIEIAGFASADFAVEADKDLLAISASTLDCVGFIPSADSGTIGPRGPPINILFV